MADRFETAGEGAPIPHSLAEAGIERASVWLAIGVKHFKNELRGRRRLHKRPDAREIDICRWWLDQERRLVEPAVIGALGASALRAVSGRSSSIASLRDTRRQLSDGAWLVVTVHPSYLLRVHDRTAAEAEYVRLAADLRAAGDLAA